MNKKRKSILALAVILIIILVIVLIFSICGTKQKCNFIEQGSSWQNDFIAALDEGDYISDNISADIKNIEVQSQEGEDGTTEFIAAKRNTDGTDIHNIQYSVKDDALIFYHYKNYSFNSDDGEKIDDSEAAETAKEFAAEFIAGGDKLEFENVADKQIKSLYVQDKVETWYAKDGDIEHYIVIDLEQGNVVYYSSSEYK